MYECIQVVDARCLSADCARRAQGNTSNVERGRSNDSGGDMTLSNQRLLSRRRLLFRTTALLGAAAGGVLLTNSARASREEQATTRERPLDDANDGEILGQGEFRYRARRHWGQLDRRQYPVRDCHGISEDRDGRIVTLTNTTRNNLIAYGKSGDFKQAWENRHPGAHGFDIVDRRGEDQYWITDPVRQRVTVSDAAGRELFHVGPEALASRYADLNRYHPTNTATLPDGDFYIADGYGSSFVHHFDPKGRYITSFGGEGDGPEHLKCPHAVWVDHRFGAPQLLVCDREHNMLKWFSLKHELLRTVDFGAMVLDDESIATAPSNVAQFGGYRNGRTGDHIAIACLRGMVLILDRTDRVVSVVGGEPATYVDGKLQPIDIFNYTFNHPHDVCVDATGALYVAQWWSNQTYPIKLEPLGSGQPAVGA